jgi:hypothetical protein
MNLLPTSSTRQGPHRAVLEVIVPQGIPPIPLMYNPTEYEIQKTNNFAEIGVPGLDTPPLQYVRGGVTRFKADLLVDTSDTLADVSALYTEPLRKLMNVNGDIHAPPILRLVWNGVLFVGVLENLTVTFILFTPQGVPIRAKLSVSLMEYEKVETQLASRPRSSPDVDKIHVVRRGDTLASVAILAYNDPTEWRQIAERNNIDDPRGLPPGATLEIPRLQ